MAQQFRSANLAAAAAVTAALAWMPAAPAAQAPSGAQAGKLTIVGCVERAQRDGSVAGTPVGTSATSPNTADDEANSGAMVDRFLLTGAATSETADGAPPSPTTAAPAGDQQPARSYALRGHDQELRGHVGHKVEVTGTVTAPRQPQSNRAEAAAASGVQQLVVDSVKMVKESCR